MHLYGSGTVHHGGPSTSSGVGGGASRDPLSFACIKGQLQQCKPLKIIDLGTAALKEECGSLEFYGLQPPLKRIKLELEDVSDDVDKKRTVPYRTLYISDRERELERIRASQEEHNAELFFLERNGNFMEYFSWRKRPNLVLANVLQSKRLDGATGVGTESKVKSINNEVRRAFYSFDRSVNQSVVHM